MKAPIAPLSAACLITVSVSLTSNVDLSKPLNLAAALLPVSAQDTERVLIQSQNGGVDALRLAERERPENFLVREILFEPARHVNQVPAVRETGDEIASADQTADVYRANLRLRKIFGSAAGKRRRFGRGLVIGQQRLFLKPERRGRGRCNCGSF